MNRSVSYWMIVALLVSATILLPVPANAGMCATCAGKQHIMSIGKCGGCGATTSSGAFTLCPACSTAQKRCEACGSTLAPVAPKPAVKPVETADPIATPVTSPAVKPGTPPAKLPTVPVAPPAAAEAPEAKPANEAPPAVAVPVAAKP